LKKHLDTFLLKSKLGALLVVGLVLDVLGDEALASDGFNSLCKAALDLVALPWRNVGVEQDVNLFECLSVGLWEHEEDVDGHGEAEDTENDVGPPLDVGKGWCDEVRKREVENPVCGGRETDTGSAVLEREDFGRVNPTARCPGESVESDKDITDGDDALGSVVVVDLPSKDSVAID